MLGTSISRWAMCAAVFAVVAPANAERTPEPLPAAADLADRAVTGWQSLRDTLLPQPANPELGRAVALQLFQATAGVSVSAVPLPSIAGEDRPLLEVVPIAEGELSSSHGTRRDPINGRAKHHHGVDFSADHGTAVLASAAGVVIKAEYHRGYGRVVYIDHGTGFVTRYAHLSRMVVREGDGVAAGMRIGAVGASGRATGAHLHFELRVLGHDVDPLPALGIEQRRLSERLGDLLELPFREHRAPERGRDRT